MPKENLGEQHEPVQPEANRHIESRLKPSPFVMGALGALAIIGVTEGSVEGPAAFVIGATVGWALPRGVKKIREILSSRN